MDVQSGTPQYTNKDIKNLEKIQRRATRFILNDYSWNTSVSQLLLDLNLPSLQSRRSAISYATRRGISLKIIEGLKLFPWELLR